MASDGAFCQLGAFLGFVSAPARGKLCGLPVTQCLALQSAAQCIQAPLWEPCLGFCTPAVGVCAPGQTCESVCPSVSPRLRGGCGGWSRVYRSWHFTKLSPIPCLPRARTVNLCCPLLFAPPGNHSPLGRLQVPLALAGKPKPGQLALATAIFWKGISRVP